MAFMHIQNLTKSYPSSNFELNIENLIIKKGSITAIAGPNGAGKTTFLKLIVKLLHPTRGKIDFMGQNLNENLIINNISYMPGEKSLYENMTISQLLKFTSQSVPHWDNNKAEQLLAIFPLKMNKKISTLSYGEKTQLYAILTFAKDVPFIILDEPTQGLDPVMQEKMLNLIKAESSKGKTILFSSHQLNEVESTADTIAIIKSGQILIYDEIDELKENLYMIVTNNPSELNKLNKLSIYQEGEQTILIVRKNESMVEDRYEAIEVNLTDIFLNLINGEVIK